MAAPTNQTNAEIFHSLINTLDLVCQQLKDETELNTRIEDFNIEEYWKSVDAATKLICHEATKICLMFSKPPLPTVEECQGLSNSLESSCVALLSIYFKLPVSMGHTLHKDVYFYVLNIFQAVKDFCIEVKQNSAPRQLQSVGNVWEKCNCLEKMPRDNKDAVLAIFHDQLFTVQDAIEELQQNIDNEDENMLNLEDFCPANGFRLPEQELWSDQDRNILPPSLGLVKSAKACLKKFVGTVKAKGNSVSIDKITELDILADLGKHVSALVDDFILSLYPPMSHGAVKEQAINLKEHMLKMLLEIKKMHCYHDTDETWISFLHRALNHNFSKICELIPD